MIGLEYILNLYNIKHIELAEKLGIKKQNINLWIKQKQNIPKKYLPQLEELFKVNSKFFEKELTEIEKLEIQKEKLKTELNPLITLTEKNYDLNSKSFEITEIYNKEEINKIEYDIHKAKIFEKFKNSLESIDNYSYLETIKLITELIEKIPNEILFHKTIEALAHYFEIIPENISSGEEQKEFEDDIFEVFDDNNY